MKRYSYDRRAATPEATTDLREAHIEVPDVNTDEANRRIRQGQAMLLATLTEAGESLEYHRQGPKTKSLYRVPFRYLGNRYFICDYGQVQTPTWVSDAAADRFIRNPRTKVVRSGRPFNAGEKSGG